MVGIDLLPLVMERWEGERERERAKKGGERGREGDGMVSVKPLGQIFAEKGPSLSIRVPLSFSLSPSFFLFFWVH